MPGPNEQTKIDMHTARSQSTIHMDAVRDYLYDGRTEWDSHVKVVDTMKNDPVFDKSQRLFMTRSDRYKRGLAMTNRIYELSQLHGWTTNQNTEAISLLDEGVPMNLHSLAFEPVIMSQGSPALISEYGKLIASRGILGSYLQTELGHGTNVSQLETTATYTPTTDEFVINSPSVTSTKWWIGALGRTATHGVVQAKLILLSEGGKERDMGPHLFFVQLRSLDDHKVLPGIRIGDIGPKAMGGMASVDNGFARFDHVRIPRDHMLSKFAQVTPEGKYVQPPHAKLSYGGMLYIRSSMVTSAGWTLAKGATISIRYGTVRRQGNKHKASGLESQTIAYPSVHYRLLPILAHAYVFIQLGRNLTKAFAHMTTRLASGDTSLLAEMHATTSGLKVLITSMSIQDLEVARRSMGGHGYSGFAGLGRIYAEYLPAATYEGDNFVLDQQVVRAALKSYNNLMSAKAPSTDMLSPSSYYLRLLLPSSKPTVQVTDGLWKDYSVAISLLEQRAALMVQDLAGHAKSADASANQRVSKAVTEAFVAAQVGLMIQALSLGDADNRVIRDLYCLYLLTTLESSLVDLLSFKIIIPTTDGADPVSSLRAEIASLCLDLLPNAIGLTDAFGFTDWELDSALGVHDGAVYDALWEKAQTEPLNREEVTSGYSDHIKPMLERGQRLAGSKL